MILQRDSIRGVDYRLLFGLWRGEFCAFCCVAVNRRVLMCVDLILLVDWGRQSLRSCGRFSWRCPKR